MQRNLSQLVTNVRLVRNLRNQIHVQQLVVMPLKNVLLAPTMAVQTSFLASVKNTSQAHHPSKLLQSTTQHQMYQHQITVQNVLLNLHAIAVMIHLHTLAMIAKPLKLTTMQLLISERMIIIFLQTWPMRT